MVIRARFSEHLAHQLQQKGLHFCFIQLGGSKTPSFPRKRKGKKEKRRERERERGREEEEESVYVFGATMYLITRPR